MILSKFAINLTSLKWPFDKNIWELSPVIVIVSNEIFGSQFEGDWLKTFTTEKFTKKSKYDKFVKAMSINIKQS